MKTRVAVVALACAAIASSASSQTKKPTGTKAVTYDVTINADAVYTGTMEMAVAGGKVIGSMNLTSPTRITGKVAGTSKAGVLSLEFPYVMTERGCEGNVKMSIKMPPKPGPAAGTMEAGPCGGGDPGQKVTGTVDLKPAAATK
jgi:hypothetical protein